MAHRHGDFLADQVQLIGAAAHPWTFGPENGGNLKPQDPITVLRTEFLHPCFDYQPEHCWAIAYIDPPLDPALSLSGRRRCHLDWVRLWAGHDQFAAGIPL
jgi:hypothetical protein